MKKKIFYIFIVIFILFLVGIYLYKDNKEILAEIKLDEGFIPSYGNILNASDGYFIILKAVNSKIQDKDEDFLFYIFKIDFNGNVLWRKTLNENVLKLYEVPFVYKDNLYFLALNTKYEYGFDTFSFEDNNLLMVKKSGEIEKVLKLDAVINTTREIKQIKDSKFILLTIDKSLNDEDSFWVSFWKIDLDKSKYNLMWREDFYYLRGAGIILTDNLNRCLYKFYLEYHGIIEISVDSCLGKINERQIVNFNDYDMYGFFRKNKKFYIFREDYNSDCFYIIMTIYSQDGKRILKNLYKAITNYPNATSLYPTIKASSNKFLIFGNLYGNPDKLYEFKYIDKYFLLVIDTNGKKIYEKESDGYILHDAILKDNKIISLASRGNNTDNKILILQQTYTKEKD